MEPPTEARRDGALAARVLRQQPLRYRDGASADEDRPAHVRAASGITAYREYLVIIQDDANWLALLDADGDVHPLPLPPGPESGQRVFSKRRGNKHEKFDLEACVTLPGSAGPELIAFGSGSHEGREWILRLHEGETFEASLSEQASHAELGLSVTAEFVACRRFYDALRDTTAFAGAGLNIEGAVPLGGNTIRLFQRGNAPARDGLSPVDATGDVAWAALAAHLAEPARVPPPEVTGIRRYDLGSLDGVRLTFSDAEHLGEGRILYSASAEHPESGEIVGSALGVLEADGEARWTAVTDASGGDFEGKIEGLSLSPGDPGLVHFVTDDDDEDAPSVLYTVRLNDAFFTR